MVPPRGHPLRKTGHPLPWHGHPGNNIPPPMIEFTRHDLVFLDCHSFSDKSQTNVLTSSLHDARELLSGEKAIPRTCPLCPSRTRTSLPVALSYSRTVLSQCHTASIFP